MSKRMIPPRPSFVQQARMRRARAAVGPPAVSSQCKGVRLSRDGRVIMNRTERRRTAYHEAGHAVIYAVLGIRFRLVTVIPSVHLLGRIERRRPFGGWVRQPRIQIERLILGTLAGGIAERLSRRDGQASEAAEKRLRRRSALCPDLKPGACRPDGGRLCSAVVRTGRGLPVRLELRDRLAESFNGRFREECLNTYWFLSLDRSKLTTPQARRMLIR